MIEKATEKLKLTLVKSTAHRLKSHKACVQGLGLRHTQHSVVVLKTPCNLGMINKVNYLLKIEEA